MAATLHIMGKPNVESANNKGRANHMIYKKRLFWIFIAIVILVAGVCIGLAMNRPTIDLPAADAITSITMEQFKDSISGGEIKITDIVEIESILKELSGAVKTHRWTVNDYPTEAEYLVVRLFLEGQMRTLCLYSDGADYIEEPYVAVYRTKKGFDHFYASYSAYIQNEIDTSSDGEVTQWVDYYKDEAPWGNITEWELPEFSGVTFRWTPYEVSAIEGTAERMLFSGMPIWSVYFSDLNGDELPELCSTISIGSGMIDTRVIVYDYANDRQYELEDRGVFDYFVSLADGRLLVTQTHYDGDTEIATGELTIVNEELTANGIDRSIPVETPPSDSAMATSGWQPTFNVMVGPKYLLFEEVAVELFLTQNLPLVEGDYFSVKTGTTPRDKIVNSLGQQYEIYYTLNGSIPTMQSTKYDDIPIIFYSETPKQFTINTLAVFQDGSQSDVVGMTYSFGDSEKINQVLADAINEVITPGMSEFEKIKGIHDWLILHTEYDFSIYDPAAFNTPWYLSDTVAGLVYADKLVCGGYADAFYKLCLRAGLNVKAVEGSVRGEGHAWNVVEMDGDWYHVDCTWDDNGEDNIGYDFFLKSDEFMREERTWRLFERYHDLTEELPECSSNYIWQ